MRVLLDTHAFLWWTTNNPQLSVGVDDAVVIQVLLALIRHPGLGPAEVVRSLRGHSPPIVLEQVVAVFARYALEEVGKKGGLRRVQPCNDAALRSTL
ncbi:MAG: hypothetical protein K9L82_16375 [Chromatiaceae bacterium]|nr:hypothetical protein [Chromatiaceae bacterium]